MSVQVWEKGRWRKRGTKKERRRKFFLDIKHRLQPPNPDLMTVKPDLL